MQHKQGFTLIEVILAMGILAVAALGTLAALMSASHDIHAGQLKQYKAALAEQRTQLLSMTDKTQILTSNTLYGTVGSYPAGGPPTVAPGATPWQLDPQGAFFAVNEAGVITPTAVAGATNCASTSIPVGVFCREVALTTTLPDGTQPGVGTPYTIWTRVIRVGDATQAANPSLYAVVERMVVVQ